MDRLIYASVARLAAAIQAGDVTSEALVSAYLERIEAVNPKLNAVVALTAEAALAQARAADVALQQGDVWGALHGVPMTIKDSFDTAGVVTTYGTPGCAHHVPKNDATVVARLKAAGAILMGKTNTPEFTLSYETNNPVYGRTANPYDLSRMPGGSSGGAAAIVAAGGSPFDIGSDTGGSIRLPSHFCGLAGIKPTSGCVPRTGLVPPPGGYLDTLTQVGPMARHVEDLELLLRLIAGPDGRDPSIAPVPLREPGAVTLKTLRGAFHTDNGIAAATAETAAVVQAAVEALAAAGLSFAEKRPDGIEETLDIIAVLMRGWDGGAWVRLLLERAGTAEADSSLGRYLEAPARPAEEYVHILDRFDRFRRRMGRFWDDFDVLICPANAYPALKNDELYARYPGFSYTMSYNLTGWPAAVVRAGTAPGGLPIGVQVVAPPWREDIALAVAQQIEQALGGWRPPPL